MKLHYKFGTRYMALLLTVAMVFSYLPGIALTASAAAGDATITDPHTLDQWKNYFGVLEDNENNVRLTTEYAGGVWTDKSVFDPDTLPNQLTGATYNGNGISITDKGDNFLVSLSAIASNKQIKGYSTVPTDTVLVLDLSSSMRYTDDAGTSAVDEMIEATNNAMSRLLALNKNNRIAVVVYAGNTNKSFSNGSGNVSVVLPLDSYTTDNTGVYLQADPLYVQQGRQQVLNTNPYGLAVYDGVSSASGNANTFRTNSFEVATGTFFQGGIFEAMNILLNANPVVEDGLQKGTNRMPIMVWMTDGEPTLANPDYNGTNNQAGTTTMYDYSGSTGGTNSYGHRDTIAFITSLTAAYANKTIAAHYGQSPLIYTLPYGDTVMNRPEALSIMNPAQASTIQNNLWNAFLRGDDVRVYRYRQNNRDQYYTVSNSSVASERLETADRLYVDKYFPANNDEEMLQAFQDIVDEIILQSKYYPTYVQKDVDHDGYLTFVDKIGEYMEVSDVKGIIIGDRLFSGAALAGMFNEGSLGTPANPSALGNAMVNSVKERLGIADTAVAQALLNDAYTHGQLKYNSDTDFSHYIGWFSDSEGNYLDFWHQGMTAEQTPVGATHIIRSYAFLGDTAVIPGLPDTDMMYMSVRVAREIATGDTVVTWQIPASLIPTLTYEVEVEVDSDGNITRLLDLNMESNTAESPIRLVYEVELQGHIQDWNLASIVDTNYTANKDPGYVFYSNKWTENAEDTSRNTYSHFEPSVENERYYFTQDTVILVKNGDSYVPYTDSARPSGDGYYYSYQCYELLTNGSLRTHEHFEPITNAVLNETGAVAQENGQWVVKKGTVHRYYDYEITPKVTGEGLENTNTMDHSDHPFMYKQGSIYYTYSTQGNNGKLYMTPATGIKLTKTLAEGFSSEDTFTFQISGAIGNAQVVRLDENGLEASRTALPANGQVTLAAGETVYIVGLTASAYTVSEILPADADYSVASVLVDQTAVVGKAADVTLTAQDITEVEFVNGPMGYGNLIVSKDVVHPFTSVPQGITDKTFDITVQLIGEDVANAVFEIHGISGTTQITTDADGKIQLQLRHGESVTILGIPEQTTYTVTENLTAADAGYRLDTQNSTLEGSIVKNESAVAQVVNIYEPEAPAATSVTVTGTKTVTSQSVPYDWTDKSFTFKLESYDPETQTYTQLETATVTTDGGSYTFSSLKFNNLGTYYYKVSEVIPETREEHMSYDASSGRFVVHVTDNDVDGYMEVDVRDYATDQSLVPSGNVITFEKNFVNTYTEDYDPTAVEFTMDKEIADTHNTGITAAGFLFGLYRPGETQPVYTMRTTGADGLATFHIPVTAPTAGDTYILKEIVPADADKIPGMLYSTQEYTVVISATAEGSVLTGTVTIDGQVGMTPVFTNTMNMDTASAQFGVEKVLQGAPTTETFNFTLVETDSSFITAKAGGVNENISITNAGTNLFSQITYTSVGTHYYVVRETNGGRGGMVYDAAVYHITVDVTVSGDSLVAASSIVKVGEGAVEDIIFTNTYTVSGATTATIRGTKTLTGRALLNGEFKFRLVEVNADGTVKENGLTMEAENGPANGNNQADILFAPITYTEIGEYYYKITEIKGADNVGLTYDDSYGIVKVSVADNNAGGLSASWSLVEGDVAFANRYKPSGTSTQIFSSKDLTGRVLRDGEFFFEMYKTGADFVTDGLTPKTVSNNSHGVIDFGTLYYTDETVEYYAIKEQAGAVGGVTYDPTVYRVTIRVVDNQKGSLETFVAIEMVDEEGTVVPVSSIVFYNEYAPESTEVVFTAEKFMTGLNDRAGYQFGISTEQGGQPFATATSDADGVVSFAPVPYTYKDLEGQVERTFTYYISEITPEGAVDRKLNGITYDDKVYTVVVTLKDNLEGQLVATYTVDGADVDEATYRFGFTNVYEASAIDYTLRATKVYERGDKDEMREFDFILEGEGFAAQTKQNNGEGHITFDPLPFDKAGTYTFTIREVHNILWGFIKWDANVYTVTITVEEDTSRGVLFIDPAKVVITSQEGRNDLVFRNVHQDMITDKDVVNVEAPSISIDGEKVRVGDILRYTIAYTNYTSKAQKVTITDKVPQYTAYEDGSASGQVQILQDGSLFWDLGDVQPETTVTVEFQVKVIGAGAIENQAVILEGENTYYTNVVTTTVDYAETQWTPTGEKKLHYKGIAPDMFSFRITGHGIDETVKNTDGGVFAFSPVKYTVEDAGKTFTYKISEVEPDGAVDHVLNGITYDQTVYTVEVRPVYNDLGQLITRVTVAGTSDNKVVFNNYYNVTGEGTVSINGSKAYTDENTGETKTMEPGQFTFKLTGHGQDLTATNDASGNFKFAIGYTADDIGKTYVYTVEEVAGDKDYITYDGASFRVQVEVKDNGNGGLDIVKTLLDGPVVFENTYKIITGGSVTIEGNKSYIDSNTGKNKTMEPGQFTFKLTGHGKNLTATGDAKGNFSFAIDYTKADLGQTYIYTIEEVAGDKDYITYDDASFRVQVKITDDGKGGLNIEKTLLDGNVEFENFYNTTGTGSVTIGGTKAYIDSLTGNAKNISAGMFSFRLTGNGVDETVDCVAGGGFRFGVLTYDKADIGKTYTYTVSEVKGDKDYITYDDTSFRVQVTVTDDGKGGLHIEKTLLDGEIAFENTYKVVGEGSVEIPGTKAYINGNTGAAKDMYINQFQFRLSGHGKRLLAAADESGNFKFTLHYTASDVGQTYIYTVEEVRGDVDYITYDTNKFRVQVEITDNGRGGLNIEKTLLDGELAFENTYNTIGQGTVAISGNKSYVNGLTGQAMPIGAEMFAFRLTGNGVDETVFCNANGEFAFTELTYSAADLHKVYTYSIEEVAGDKAYISYDNAKYVLTVAVNDNGVGGLDIVKSLTKDGVKVESITFANTYKVIGNAQVDVLGVKRFLNADTQTAEQIEASTFVFRLTGHGIHEVVSNVAGGNFDFKPLTFTADDIGKTFVYTIEEVAGNRDNITYDDHKYTLVITVEDNGMGGLKITKTLDGQAVEHVVVSFTNIYKEIFRDELKKDVFAASNPQISIDGEKVQAGETLLYKVTYTNVNDRAATVQITDVIPSHTTYVAGSASDQGVYADGKLVWTLELAGGETKTVQFQVKVNDADITVTNQATALKGDNKITSNTVTNPVVEDKFEKDVFLATGHAISIDGEKVQVGEVLLYTITYVNADHKASTVQITDIIPAHTTYVAGSASDRGVYADGKLVWTLELAGGETKTVQFQVKVNDANSTVTNQATALEGENRITSNLITNQVVEDEVKKDVFLADKPEISIDGEKVQAGKILHYTITYTNADHRVSTVQITDTIPAHTSYVDGTASDGGIFEAGAIRWTLDLAAGESKTVHFQVKVDDVNVTVTNQAVAQEGENRITSNVVTNEVVEDKLEKDVFLAGKPEISIDGEKVQVGDILLYTISYVNSDVDAATVRITDTIPAHTSYVDGTASDGAVYADGKLVWTLDVAGGEIKSVSFQVKVDDPDVFIDNQATAFDGTNTLETKVITTHTYEEVGGKDVALAEEPQISIDGKMVQVGQILEYSINYTNTTDAPIHVTITDRIPAYTKLVDVGTGTEKDGIITWEIRDVQPREQITVTFRVEVTEPGQIIENRAEIFDGTNKVTNKVTNATPEKTVDKQTASAGEILTYTLTYRNVTGALAKVVITDKLDAALAYVEGSAGEGIYADGTITWTFENVPVDGEILVTFQAQIKADAQSVRNQAQIFENDAQVVFTNETNTQVLKPALEISKQQSVNDGKATDKKLIVKKGDEVTYILTVTNTGEGDAYGISVADKIPAGLQFVSAQNGGQVIDGVVVWQLAQIKAGESVELRFQVKIPEVQLSTAWTNVAALIYANNPDGEDEVIESNEVEIEQLVSATPETGDDFQMVTFISLMVLSTFGIAAVTVAKKREEEKETNQ